MSFIPQQYNCTVCEASETNMSNFIDTMDMRIKEKLCNKCLFDFVVDCLTEDEEVTKDVKKYGLFNNSNKE